jgi:putative DNA primase/helicase
MAQTSGPADASAGNPTPKAKPDAAKKGRAASSTAEVVNAIDFAPVRPRSADSEDTLAMRSAPIGDPASRGKKSKKKDNEVGVKQSLPETRTEQIPDTVRERFIQIGNNFYFPDGAEAFTDHGNRVTTRSENAIVIQSMVAIAQERAAGAVTVTGTDLFKREAWFAARLAGLDVLGYEPTALEQQRLVRALARRRTPEQEEEPSTPDAPGRREAQKAERPRSEPSKPAPREAQPHEGEIIVGRLVDHGPAPYQHKTNQPMSYYVRIETDRGDREIWGVDLERAFRQSLSTPRIGDEVGVRASGRDPVTVLAPKHDATGREVGREELDTHRNQWIVERKNFLDRRRKMADLFRNPEVSVAEGVKQYPELEGSYLQLQIARTGTEQRIPNREAREQFVDHLRTHLAKTIEYGQALEPVHLKARAESVQESEKVQDRDCAPAR